MKNTGKIGCGCLTVFFVIAIFFVLILHPLTLKFFGKKLEYEDKIVPSDAIFVPFFPEDLNGELYTEAIREFWAGNAKFIYIEDRSVFSTTTYKVFLDMARQRGIKEKYVKSVRLQGGFYNGMDQAQKYFAENGMRKVIVISPSYASLRTHILLKKNEKVKFLVKACPVTYFKKDAWWKDSLSRTLFLKELFALSSYFLEKFKYGTKKEDGKR